MRLALREVCGRIVHDQVRRVHRFADRTIPKRAEIDLLERRAAEPEHEQHAVGVRVILGRHTRQIMVHVLLKRVAKTVLCCTVDPTIGRLVLWTIIEDGVVGITDLDRTICRQHLGTGIGLEAEHRLLQQRMANLRHALHWSTIRCPLKPGNLDLGSREAECRSRGTQSTPAEKAMSSAIPASTLRRCCPTFSISCRCRRPDSRTSPSDFLRCVDQGLAV